MQERKICGKFCGCNSYTTLRIKSGLSRLKALYIRSILKFVYQGYILNGKSTASYPKNNRIVRCSSLSFLLRHYTHHCLSPQSPSSSQLIVAPTGVVHVYADVCSAFSSLGPPRFFSNFNTSIFLASLLHSFSIFCFFHFPL